MKKSIKIDNYKLTFNNDVKYKLFENNQYYGVSFIDGEDKYEILHNKDLGNRLLINKKYYWHDIPLKKETFGLLPKFLSCEEV
jgi:hypothetical protein